MSTTIAWTPALRELVAPRRGDVRPIDLDPAVAWARLRRLFAKSAAAWKASASLKDPQVGPLLRAAIRKLETKGEGVPPAASPEVESVVLALLSRQDGKEEACFDGELVAVWSAAGLPFAIEALQTSLGFAVRRSRKVAELRPVDPGLETAAERAQGLRHWAWLRRLLAAADEAEWTAARDVAARLRAGAPLSVRALLSYLFPDTAWPAEDARELLAIPFDQRDEGVGALLLSAVRESDLLESLMSDYSWGWSLGAAEDPQQSRRGMILTMVDGAGPGALPALLGLLRGEPPAEARKDIWDVLGILGTPEVAAFLGSRLEKREGVAAMEGFAERFPRLALPALATQARRPAAASLLTQVARREPANAADLLAGLPEPGRGLVAAALTRVELPPEAEPGALPRVLASPPWHGKKRRKEPPAVLDLPPLPWEETAVWPAGIREAWRAPIFWDDFYEDPETRTGEILESLELQGLVSWETLDEESLRRTIAAELAGHSDPIADPSLLALLPERLALAIWESMPPAAWDFFSQPFRLVVQLEERVLPGLLRVAPMDLARTISLFLPLRSPRLAPLAARALARLKKAQAEARLWLLTHDECAAVGLIPVAVGPADGERAEAEAALRFLAANGRRELILEVAGRWGGEAREAVRALLDADPLELFPDRLPKMPAFWKPASFARPLLRGRTAALPLSAVEALGAMLAFSRLDVPYAGLLQVREACDPASLAAFAWDLFSAWMAAGAPAKEQWALLALGHCGDDGTARRLAPLVREWPGQASHARAVAGLDVLAAIGTDVALMHLHGIAQKIKFKGLQDRAQEKIEEVAELRGLTPDELADRLVPDLGLGPDGSRVLDFGPRSFRVGFDEHLKPFVRDAEGRRLSDLPKPVKADDAKKAKEAQESWKALKKDAKTLAAQQILRLETAMCQRRRWEPDVFRMFFVEHPLLQHLVRRLVWGAWDDGGRLAGTFRVAEDGTVADIADDSWELPAGTVAGLVHRLDLTDGETTRWGEVFADYEILQPFAQLGREVETIREDEREMRELRRFAGMKVPTGKVLDLANRGGWRRGPALDDGVVFWMARPLPGGSHEARLALEPGLFTADLKEEPEQTLGLITLEPALPFGALDPIPFSELVRELERLR